MSDYTSTLDTFNTCLEIITGIQSILDKYPNEKNPQAYSEIDKTLSNLRTELQNNIDQVSDSRSQESDTIERDDNYLTSPVCIFRIWIKEHLPS